MRWAAVSLRRNGAKKVEEAVRITFVVAVFDELHWLRAALVHLLQSGIEPRHLLLIANQNAFDGQLKTEWDRDDDITLRDVATWVRGDQHNCSSWMDRQSPEQEGQFYKTVENLVQGFQNWLLPDRAQELDYYLKHGSGALFVSVLDEDLLAGSCQVLLRYASRNVQTHQVKI